MRKATLKRLTREPELPCIGLCNENRDRRPGDPSVREIAVVERREFVDGQIIRRLTRTCQCSFLG